MWYDGAPHQGQCEGCTFNVWHMNDAVHLNARGVSFAVLTPGQGGRSLRRVRWAMPSPGTRCEAEALIGGATGQHYKPSCATATARPSTYSTTGRGNEPADTSSACST